MKSEKLKNARIYLAGHNGMVGSAIFRLFRKEGFRNIITASRTDLDLLNQESVYRFLKTTKPEYTIITAAKVGGINANITYPAQFLYENLRYKISQWNNL